MQLLPQYRSAKTVDRMCCGYRWCTETWSPATSCMWMRAGMLSPSGSVTLVSLNSWGQKMVCLWHRATLLTLSHPRYLNVQRSVSECLYLWFISSTNSSLLFSLFTKSHQPMSSVLLMDADINSVGCLVHVWCDLWTQPGVCWCLIVE